MTRRVANARREEPAERASWTLTDGIPIHSARRAARGAELLQTEAAPRARHAAKPHRRPLQLLATVAAGAVLLIGSSAAMTTAVAETLEPARPTAEAVAPAPEAIEALPVPTPAPSDPPPAPAPAPTVAVAEVTVEPCALPELTSALAAGDDAAAIAALGGADLFRAAVAGGQVPCVSLADPARVWTVVNKTRPLAPIDFAPGSLALPPGVRSLEGGELRADAASTLSALVAAAAAAGVGEIALESGYRSYRTQQDTYGRHVAARGAEGADQVSARPGYSEHQTGLGADVVACGGDGCGSLEGLAGTPQGQWVAAHSWEHGWIVRYVDGATPVTGYVPEPWHLRYVGPELARAYHDGGWTSLEEFFGLPAAPAYPS
jgi:D-alanyl-D-alanine carboxypeptidase